MPMPPKFPIDTVELTDTAERFLSTKKQSTAKAYRLCLKRFRYFYGKPLGEFIKEIEEQVEANKSLSLAERVRPGEQTVRDFIEWHSEVEYAPKATRQSIAALQNALKFYGIQMSFEFIELPPARPLRKNDKHEWTLDQVRQLVDALPYVRDKAIALMAFQSGLGISDLLNVNYGDIAREYEAGTIPIAIEGYRQKTGIRIRTFVGRDSVKYLRIYLSSREPLNRDEPLFTLLGSTERMTGAAIRKQFREAAEKLPFILDEDLENGYNPGRPHSLRSGFRSRLTGKMDGDLIETFMAHEIGQQRSTYLALPIDELRQLYANHEHLLAVEKTSLEEQSEGAIPESAMKEILAQKQRITELEADMQRLREDHTRQYRELVQQLRRLQ